MLAMGRVLDIETNYSREYIVSVLKDNRAKHIDEYKKAKAVYLEDIRNALEGLKKATIQKLKEDSQVPTNGDNVSTAYSKWLNNKPPVNATKMYDQYINLFEQSVSAEISLTMGDANAIINDEWDWAVVAKTTNSFYASRAL